jgi:hypothetical protein
MKHYLITRWNVDIYDSNWLKERQRLFERFCLPSVRSQTNSDFEWLLISDQRTPDKFRSILDSYPATVVYVDFSSYKFNTPALKADVSDIMRRSVQLECIGDIVSSHIGHQDTDYVITSRCDSDDALSIDHIEKVQRLAKENWNGRSFWLSLTQGYKLQEGIVYPVHSIHNPFISRVEAPSELITCYDTCHTLVRDSVDKTISIGSYEPTWLQVIHGSNLMNKVRRIIEEFPEEQISGRFKYEYGNR